MSDETTTTQPATQEFVSFAWTGYESQRIRKVFTVAEWVGVMTAEYARGWERVYNGDVTVTILSDTRPYGYLGWREDVELVGLIESENENHGARTERVLVIMTMRDDGVTHHVDEETGEPYSVARFG